MHGGAGRIQNKRKVCGGKKSAVGASNVAKVSRRATGRELRLEAGRASGGHGSATGSAGDVSLGELNGDWEPVPLLEVRGQPLLLIHAVKVKNPTAISLMQRFFNMTPPVKYFMMGGEMLKKEGTLARAVMKNALKSKWKGQFIDKAISMLAFLKASADTLTSEQWEQKLRNDFHCHQSHLGLTLALQC